MIPVCVAVVLWDHQGRVATTARRHDPNSWGLPGGKIEPQDGDTQLGLDATLRNAAARELREETGVVVGPEDLTLVYAGVCQDQSGGGDPDSITFTFEAPHFEEVPDLNSEDGEPEVRWNEWDVLTEDGAFSDYNSRVLNTGMVHMRRHRVQFGPGARSKDTARGET